MEYINNIPEPVRGAIKRYVFDGIRPGHFLTCVMNNDLFGAIGRADESSLECLSDIIKLFYNRLPGQCWGTEDKIEHWINMSDLDRHSITMGYKSDLAYL
jgi:hypothetical protein|tara:strand:- start:276 stop:575 length:300 start_codon:yes stop_codon:yes gene_type:complete